MSSSSTLLHLRNLVDILKNVRRETWFGNMFNECKNMFIKPVDNVVANYPNHSSVSYVFSDFIVNCQWNVRISNVFFQGQFVWF